MTNASNHVTLVQLEDMNGNVTHSCSIAGKWIFDSNFKKALPLDRESFDLICCSDDYGKEKVGSFRRIHCAMKFVPSGKNKVKYNNVM